MKKFLGFISTAILSLVFITNLNAQAPKAYKLDLAESTFAPAYALPITTVKVCVLFEKETMRTGPYARFAQKYLGAIAPLSDKIIYSIKSAVINYEDPDSNMEMAKMEMKAMMDGAEQRVVSHIANAEDFTKLLPDRSSITNRTLEDMARDAASTIFVLRKRRQDLVTGETGENVYGDGLKDAVEEMLRMENELLALFFGKQTITPIIKVFSIVPEMGKTNYIAFRFSPTVGPLPESDVSGAPIVLTIRADNNVGQSGGAKGRVTYYRVADWTWCNLMDGSVELATARVPIYQFGATVAVSIPK